MKLALSSAGVWTCRSLTVEDTDNKRGASKSLLCVPQQRKQSGVYSQCQPGDRNASSGTDVHLCYNSDSLRECCESNIIKPLEQQMTENFRNMTHVSASDSMATSCLVCFQLSLKGPMGSFLDELDPLLSSFLEDGTLLILLGDFNIHLKAPQTAAFLLLLRSFNTLPQPTRLATS